MQVGGFGEMWRRVEAGQRVEFFEYIYYSISIFEFTDFNLNSFNPNPFVRHTFWTIMVGGTLTV